jgi:hypothetical protein
MLKCMVSLGLDFFDLVMVRSRGGLPRTPSRPLTISAIGATSEPQNKCAYGTAFPGPMAEQGAKTKQPRLLRSLPELLRSGSDTHPTGQR